VAAQGSSSCATCRDPQQHELMQQLASWVPCSCKCVKANARCIKG
jgi:hypothetical protein